MERLRTPDDRDEAARQVFQRYAHRLIGLARTRLDALTRRQVSPEDVVQSVLRSFFLRQAGGQYNLANWDSLWSMLVVITLRKCIRKIKYTRAGIRDVRREVPAPEVEEGTIAWEAMSDDPTPEAAVTLAETVEEIMARLDDRERQMLTLTLQGYSPQEISPQVGRTERTVHRLLAKVRSRLERMHRENLLKN
jgi:RNA polymerase sigma-70 factor (ECF subfamily)